MKLSEYFESTKGLGVLSTSDGAGNVNAALYSRPRFLDDETVAFIMNDRRSKQNLDSNPRASFLYRVTNGEGSYEGKRLYLTKLDERRDPDLVEELRRRRNYPGRSDYSNEGKSVVSFRIVDVRPLVGGDDEEQERA